MPLALVRQSSLTSSLNEFLQIGSTGRFRLTVAAQEKDDQQSKEERRDRTQRKKQGSDPRPEPYQERGQKLNG
jgi:hypothetical protein